MNVTRSKLSPRRRFFVSVAAVACLATCGGSSGTTSTVSPSPTTSAKRLSCADVRTFVVTSAPIGETLEYDPTAELAIARAKGNNDEVASSMLIGPDDRSGDEADRTMKGNHEGITETVRYALLDRVGTVAEEVVVAKTADGWIALRFDSCP